MVDTVILRGNIITTASKEEFAQHNRSYLVAQGGMITGIYNQLPAELEIEEIHDYGEDLIIPSFIDLHVHAPQFVQRGLGLDMELIDWLNKYTFPHERDFEDREHARKIYPHFAQSLLEVGTLRSSIFATIHREATEILIEALEDRGLFAMVGKVNMDQNAPDYLNEATADSLKQTESFIRSHLHTKGIRPIITPRFAPSCSSTLMKELGKLAEKYELPIQSHISENLQEVAWVKELFPESSSYSQVYKDHGLWNDKTLMAHGVYLTPPELEMMKQTGVTVVHCPEANLNLTSGIMSVTEMVDRGINVGLGSDVGAGQSMAMNRVMVRAVQSSKALARQTGSRPLKLSEAFFLGTKANGRLWGRTGSLEEGYSLDALVIHDDFADTIGLAPLEKLQRFLYTGDDRNIVGRWLEGERL